MKKARKTKRADDTHEWKLVPKKWYAELPQEKRDEIEEEEIERMLWESPHSQRSEFDKTPFDAWERYKNEVASYLPGVNKLDEDGNWILVTKPPHAEYTVPPLSIWFAVPWPMEGTAGRRVHRVRITTPRGTLGLFPHEYSRINDMSKYTECLGDGIEIKFFGGVEGINPDALFYIRSRGISKRDAIIMLLGQIKAEAVCWLETDPGVYEYFGYEPIAPERLATVSAEPKAA